MPQVAQLRLLGDFSLVCDDAPVDGVSTPRLQSLIAYLALHRDAPQLRQRLAFLFWPDSSEGQARNNLRQLLHALRRAQPALSALLVVDGATVQWRREIELRLDVADLERALALVEADHAPSGDALRAVGEQLLALYPADLLPGCYDEWITPERERLRDRFAQALARLVALHEAAGDAAAAIRYARRLIRVDSLNEEAYRALMRLLALTGDRSGEVQVYQTCVNALQQTLGVEPSEATVALHQRLLRMEKRAQPPVAPGATSAQSGASAQRPAQSAPAPPSLVGRQREWETLQRAWQEVSAHGPGFVFITGEAGIGKSRLAEEMAQWASASGVTTATARSYPVEGRLSFAPVIEWLRSPALRPYVRRQEPVWLKEVARILPELLAENPDLPHYEPLTEYGQRQYFFQALAQAVLAAPQPILLVMDDLHWCDQETLEWLHFLLRFDSSARLLIIGAARSEETLPQQPLALTMHHLRHTVAVREIALRPLDAAETAELATRMSRRTFDVPAALRLFGETEGNPLFVIETVRAGLDRLPAREPAATPESLAQAPDATALPPGVRAVIASRLAQLTAPAREVAALAAVVGREFSLEILTDVSHFDEERMVSALDELWQRRIVQEQGPDTYDFTHDKLREVAYAEISAPQRRLLHRRVAQSLEALHHDHLDAVSGQIAAHYEHGGLAERALPFYHQAALVAQRVFAFEDAIHLLRHCLTLLKDTGSGAAHDQWELRLLLALAPLYRITRGWTAPELERVVDRTMELSDLVGDDAQRAEARYGLQSMLTVQARLEEAQQVAAELHAVYEHTNGPVPPLIDMMLAGARLHLGQPSESSDAFERVLADHHNRLDRSPENVRLQESQGWNSAIHARAWQSHALWCLGYPEQALRLGREATDLAREVGQPFNLALAATYLAMLWEMSADLAMARSLAEEALALTTEYKAPYYQAWSAILVAYAHAQEQPGEAHIAALRRAIAEFTSTGARLRLPYYLSLLARIHLQAGHAQDGLRVIEGAFEQSRSSNERWWDAELYRLRGELSLAAGGDGRAAEAALAQAATIARNQGSRALELRALLTMARLRASERQADEARRSLADLCDGFTEGSDTPDLRAARAYLSVAKRG